jgi:hypothetical protein
LAPGRPKELMAQLSLEGHGPPDMGRFHHGKWDKKWWISRWFMIEVGVRSGMSVGFMHVYAT